MQYLSIKNILIVYHLHYTSLAILNQKTSHQQYVFEMWIACSFYIIWSSLWSQVAVFKSSVIWWPTGNACYFLENTNVPQTGKAYQTTLWRVLAYHVIAYCTLFKSVIGDINMKFFITYFFVWINIDFHYSHYILFIAEINWKARPDVTIWHYPGQM